MIKRHWMLLIAVIAIPIGNRLFNHVSAWLGVMVILSAVIFLIYKLIKFLKMKDFKFLLLAFVAVVLFASCERVALNYAGVFMENYGKDGKNDFPLKRDAFLRGNGAQNFFKFHYLTKEVTLPNLLH